MESPQPNSLVSKSLVIVPTYNERENIELIVHAVLALSPAFHLLVVDDGSPDGTAGLVRSQMSLFNSEGERLFLMERSGKQGLGTAYLDAFRWALQRDYEVILQMDADFSHDPKDLHRLRAACVADGADLAIGSRYVSGVNVVNWPMGRVLLSWFASAYVRLISGLPIHDATAGFVCYRRAVLQTILSSREKVRFVGYAFQIEMKFLTWKYGYRILEVPIIFTDRTRGQSKLSAGIFQEAFFGVIWMTVRGWFRKFIPLQG